ncbi:serine/threonine-protein kinase [Kitasatospora sp. NPDC059673]|uniref:serine/threonine-protein kinase n=1 Tax=Kitasatospora sp. NPDC059673 TaxID=3346901 RepID=UPI00367D221A
MTEDRAGRLVGGRYRLVRALGAGGFGSVWLAHDETLGVDVALKEVRLPPSGTAAEHAELLARAQREARHAARLRDHPHVVGVHDVVLDGGAPWTVMQLILGRSLHERIAEGGPLPVPEAARVASAVLAALDAAHRAGIVHRDVKPANILLADDGRVLLADFGIAVQQHQTALTASGMFVGSVDYIAPERAQGGPADPAGDLFSLGATLYQAVEGRLPFRRDTPVGTLTAVLFEPPAPCVLAGPLTPLIDGLLAKDPAARLDGARAAAMLAPHLGAHPPTAAATVPHPAGTPGVPALPGVPAPPAFAPPAFAPPAFAPGVPNSPNAPTVPAAPPPEPAAPRAARRAVVTVLLPLLVPAVLGAAMPLNAFVFHPDSQLPPSAALSLNRARTPLFEVLGLDGFPAPGGSAVTLSWLWLLPTLAALLAAWCPPRVPVAVRATGYLLALVLPVRLLVADLRGADPHLVHALPSTIVSHLHVGYGPGWWLLHVAAVAAPAVLLAGQLLHRRRH